MDPYTAEVIIAIHLWLSALLVWFWFLHCSSCCTGSACGSFQNTWIDNLSTDFGLLAYITIALVYIVRSVGSSVRFRFIPYLGSWEIGVLRFTTWSSLVLLGAPCNHLIRRCLISRLCSFYTFCETSERNFKQTHLQKYSSLVLEFWCTLLGLSVVPLKQSSFSTWWKMLIDSTIKHLCSRSLMFVFIFTLFLSSPSFGDIWMIVLTHVNWLKGEAINITIDKEKFQFSKTWRFYRNYWCVKHILYWKSSV